MNCLMGIENKYFQKKSVTLMLITILNAILNQHEKDTIDEPVPFTFCCSRFTICYDLLRNPLKAENTKRNKGLFLFVF